MKIDRELLIRYLRQQGELSGGELMLESLTATELVRLLRSRPAPHAAAYTASSSAVPAAAHAAAPAAAHAAAELSPGTDRAGGVGDVGGSGGGAGVHPPAPRVTDSRAATPATGEGRRELEVLSAEAAACTRCRLSEGRQNVVFGVGNPAADVVVVGEAPGMEEDRTGKPFVGRAGKLLDLLLLSAGFPREQVYICNVLKCRPPDNRDPRPDEVEACATYLHRQLELIEPRVLLAVGKFAAQTLAGSEESIGKLRGRVHAYRGIPLVATYHPAYLLRSPQWMRAAWKDFQLVREVLEAR